MAVVPHPTLCAVVGQFVRVQNAIKNPEMGGQMRSRRGQVSRILCPTEVLNFGGHQVDGSSLMTIAFVRHDSLSFSAVF